MATTADFLARLEGVRRTGQGRWIAKCPSHEDRSPSLSVRECDDGRTLLCCFAGCEAGEVAGALGFTLRDLFPAGSAEAAHGRRLPVPAADVLRALELDALTVAVVASDLAKGKALTDHARTALMRSAGRISVAIEVAGRG